MKRGHLSHADPRSLWAMQPGVTFLNHGSFGSCPRVVLDVQQGFRERMEADAVRFFVQDLEGLLDQTRSALAAFAGCRPQDLALVSNATSGISAVLGSVELRPGDELLTTDHAYNACRNALEFAAARSGAAVVVAQVPFPVASTDDVIDAVMAQVTPRTRLALIDHVTSPTALVFPIERLVHELSGRRVDTLVDGAHAPGMVPLELARLGAAYYTANCHKWLCAPKGSGFLYVRSDLQQSVRPPVISHGANSRRTDRSRFLLEFDWTGTNDPSALLCVPAAIDTLGSLAPGGWPELMARNRSLAIQARRRVAGALSLDLACPEEMIGSMAALLLPVEAGPAVAPGLGSDPLHDILRRRHHIDAMIAAAPDRKRKCLRLSAAWYNQLEDYDRLVQALLIEWGGPAD